MANILEVTKELHKLFGFLNKAKFNNKLPEPALLIQGQGKKQGTLGWCTTAPIWKDGTKNTRYEITMAAEYMNRTYEQLSSTLLHEMVHLYNIINKIHDCEPVSQRHNTKFKDLAEKVGLIVTKDTQRNRGFCFTEVSEPLKKQLNSFDINQKVFVLSRYTLGEAGETTKKKNSMRKLVCPGCDTIVRVTKPDVRLACINCELELEEE